MADSGAGDVLLVIHRGTSPARAAAAVRGARHIFVLTSHRPFSHERATLAAALAPATSTWQTFADLLDDTALAALDDATTAALRANRPNRAAYVYAFEFELARRKNAAVHAALLTRGTFQRIVSDHGLGVDGRYWCSQGAKLLTRPTWREPLRRFSLWQELGALRLPRLTTGTVVRDGVNGYLFVAGHRRLRLRPGTASASVPLSTALADPTVQFIGTTVHDDPVAAHRLGRPVRVFVDCYLPTNYPRTFADALSEAEFVCPDPFAARWLSQHGHRTVPPPSFFDPGPFLAPAAPPAVRTVVCLLNHAGDWSALIHRSDTDLLAEAFTRLAPNFRSLHLILRPHPGMDHPEHEGPGALGRLARFVQAAGVPNLEFSRGPLANDLARGDLFLSEYSDTLIDAWRAGKLGLIVNPTRRRSFMQDFADLGFAAVDDLAHLPAALQAAMADPGAFAHRQTAAVAQYNALLAP